MIVPSRFGILVTGKYIKFQKKYLKGVIHPYNLLGKFPNILTLYFRGAVLSLNSTYQVTSVAFGDSTDQIISGGIDNVVKVWDLRKTNGDGTKNSIGPNHKPVHELAGHTDTVTGLAISPDGNDYTKQYLRGWVCRNSLGG